MLAVLLAFVLAEPVPLDMPRAEAYLVREAGVSWMEDRYDPLDLWTAQTVIGRWLDPDDRMFLLARLDAEPPATDRGVTLTRGDFADRRVPMKRKRANRDFPPAFKEAVARLSSCPLSDCPRPPRQLPHGFKDVRYWQNPTNYSDIVCTFRPEDSETYYLAVWQLAEQDDYTGRMDDFESQFLRKVFPALVSRLKSQVSSLEFSGEGRKTKDGRQGNRTRERELLRRDAHHSIAAYSNWHFTGAEEFAVLDDLPSRSFVETLTNDFPVLRAKYAAAVPTPLDGTNVLCVARIFASRDEYLDALEADGITNMTWSAAYWSPQRRELVAYLPREGEKELLKTIRHEAFHQYLSYAASMIPASPWLNEGYAEYFGAGEDERPAGDLSVLSELIAPVLMMDYEQFYAGTDDERRIKYLVAHGIAWFLEKGVRKIRFDPFKDLKHDYVRSLLKTGDMRRATAEAFKDKDRLRLFCAEWVKFWKGQ